jgi:hypothetical protein
MTPEIKITILETRQTIKVMPLVSPLKTIVVPGTQGPPGAQGLKGEAADLALLHDVLISNPSNNQFLKYMNSKWTNVDTETIDGGNW